MGSYSLSQISKSFDGKKVLDIESLEIEAGKIYALLGPNGAGKTTLLNILGFLDSPTEGDLYFRNKKVSFNESHLLPLRKEVVLINQHPILFTTTVFKNLEFGLKIRGISAKKRALIIEQSLDWVGMLHKCQARADKLSGGETQRVAIARALALSPEVILCDEPLANVDTENRATIINLLRRINAEKKITFIFTSHDKLQASSLTRHMLFLDHGKLVTGVYENHFNAVLNQQNSHSVSCFISETTEINLPSTDLKGKVRLFIDPRKIQFAGKEVSPTQENRLAGKVVQIMEENEEIRLVIDVGILLTLMMSPQEYREQSPLIGELNHFILPSEAISFYKPL
ncbi:MAG: hypothetical protein COB67_11205 [SAR324 cluster bacterium]|uniref:ABC transporter domain-containing protein n=1 Tax=SAR324 cluster bacterium TaxID=2024889 RepID=A0A2A4SV21_9DELT|nr:MAG: hypothetical protein COB67_11205 [SAR324 cluster bacterium]